MKEQARVRKSGMNSFKLRINVLCGSISIVIKGISMVVVMIEEMIVMIEEMVALMITMIEEMVAWMIVATSALIIAVIIVRIKSARIKSITGTHKLIALILWLWRLDIGGRG